MTENELQEYLLGNGYYWIRNIFVLLNDEG